MSAATKTFMARPKDQQDRRWLLVDATDQVLGRLAAKVAIVLMGKHKPQYTPHIDMGDFVVITNAEKIRLTGNKRRQKVYPYYTGWRGGLKSVPFEEMMDRDPTRVIKLAVRRMLPKSVLGKDMLRKLKIHKGSEHPHSAQKPTALDLKTI